MFGAMHFIYQINRLTNTKVDSTYLGKLANNAQRRPYMFRGRTQARVQEFVRGGGWGPKSERIFFFFAF